MVQIPHRLCEHLPPAKAAAALTSAQAVAQPCAFPAQARYVGIRPKHQSVESLDRRAADRQSKNFQERARELTNRRTRTRHAFATTGRVLLAAANCTGGIVGRVRAACGETPTSAFDVSRGTEFAWANMFKQLAAVVTDSAAGHT